jgi:putative transposase
MAAIDVQDTLECAPATAKLQKGQFQHRPRLLSDNGPCCLLGGLRTYLAGQQPEPTRARPSTPCHRARHSPSTQVLDKRYHFSLKTVVELEVYRFPSELEKALAGFIRHSNEQHYSESLDNVTPADVYFGRFERILKARDQIKQRTPAARRRAAGRATSLSLAAASH